MQSFISSSRLRFYLNRIRERLWVKPLFICLLSIAGAFVAKLVDGTTFDDGTKIKDLVPVVTSDSVETLLSIMAASMLVIATFAVTSMVSAYGSVTKSTTPRTFSLIISDDVYQNSVSTFIGAFIFSIVALTAAKNNFFEPGGVFTLFALTIFVFAVVIVTFVRWVDSIARLGRVGYTIDKVEKATADALKECKKHPTLRGLAASMTPLTGQGVSSSCIGYVQRIDIEILQNCAKKIDGHIEILTLPGAFAVPDRILATVRSDTTPIDDVIRKEIIKAFIIGGDRTYDNDPRFGMVVLTEIAGRALSPAVNDPGTAIDIIGTVVRLFVEWGKPPTNDENREICFDRVAVPRICEDDLFDDAFASIARDGAGTIEVVMRLLKALASLASIGNDNMTRAAKNHARLALKRAELALTLPEDITLARSAAAFALDENPA